ncbi:MAG: M56 and phosphodiester glycosidase domain-containing protein [Clostridia bacterium]|nr:M56 and phosphodiester glycosidase domain-containing protein [Clostridia bacterium]
MLENVFVAVVNMTFSSAIVIVAIFLFRLVFYKKLNSIYGYTLWLIVLIRLLVPISFPSIFSIFNIIPSTYQDNSTSKSEVITTMNFIHGPNGTNQTQSFNNIPENTNSTTENSTLLVFSNSERHVLSLTVTIIQLLWIFGVIVFILINLMSYLKTKNLISTAILYKELNIVDELCIKLKFRKIIPVFVSERVNTPFVFGLISPRIVLPLFLVENNEKNNISLRYILAHELVHIKRLDYIVKPLSILALCIHWFNPLVWLSFLQYIKDIEMACDEKVMSISKEDIRIEYAFTLINFAAWQNTLLNGGFSAFGQSNIKSRVTGILKYKKKSIAATFLTIFIILAVGVVLLSNSIPKFINKDNAGYVKMLKEEDRMVAQSKIQANDDIKIIDIVDKECVGKALIIKEPGRVGFVNGSSIKPSKNTFQLSKDFNVKAAVNIGNDLLKPPDRESNITAIIHNGKLAYNSSLENDIKKKFAAITNDGKLLVGDYSIRELEVLNVKEAIDTAMPLNMDVEPSKSEYKDSWGVSNRTAIGQTSEGKIILLAINSFDKSIPGIKLSSLQNIMKKLDAVTAAHFVCTAKAVMYFDNKIITSEDDMNTSAIAAVMQ